MDSMRVGCRVGISDCEASSATPMVVVLSSVVPLAASTMSGAL